MSYLPLLSLFILMYICTVDSNVPEYIILKFVKEPLVLIRSRVLQYRLLAGLWYDRFLIKRGVVPKRFYEMAKEIRNEQAVESK